MTPDFNLVIPHILQWEGTINETDREGGLTNRGIIIPTLQEAVRRNIVSGPDESREAWSDRLRRLSVEEATAIYKQMYWMDHRLNEFPAHRLAAMACDFRVTSGAALKILQDCCNLSSRRLVRGDRGHGVRLKLDGAVGSKTLGSVHRDPQGIYELLVAARRSYYGFLVIRKTSRGSNLEGWLNRVDALHTSSRDEVWT